MEKNKRHSICLMGASPSSNNRGVSALASSLVKIMTELLPNHQISILASQKKSETIDILIDDYFSQVEVLNYRLSPKSNINQHIFWILLISILYKLLGKNKYLQKYFKRNRFIKTMADSDFVGDIRGGDSFSDIYGLKRFILQSIPVFVAFFMGKRVILLPETYGPFKFKLTKSIAIFIFKKADQIMARDKDSFELVSSMCVGLHKKSPILFCPDVAFVMPSQKPEKKIDYIKNKHSLIGINVSGLLFRKGYTQKNMFGLKSDYAKLISCITELLLKNYETNLLFVPHHFDSYGKVESDRDACRKVISSIPPSLKKRIFFVENVHSQYEIKYIIGECDFFIGSRMHACIAALSQGIPTIGIAYSKKFAGVFGSIGYKNMVVDLTAVNQEEATINILQEFENSKSLNTYFLKSEIETIKNLIYRQFRKAIQLQDCNS